MGDAQDEQAARVSRLEQELLEARHAQLLHRDHVVGIEAEIGRQNAEILRLNGELRRLRSRGQRLSQRKDAQGRRIAGLQAKLATARKHNAELTRRIRALESTGQRTSLARRVVRRVRGTGR